MHLESLRVRILVKAYPQPSKKYRETVCVAAITDEPRPRFVRLYPIRYRDLPQHKRFERFDLVSLRMWRDSSDFRPESHKVDEDSIEIVESGKRLNSENRFRVWRPFIFDNFRGLKARNVDSKVSLGIIRPDEGSLEFLYYPESDDSDDDRAISVSLNEQMNLLQPDLEPIARPEWSFKYRFTSGGERSTITIQDWEIQAALHNFRKMYGRQEGFNRLVETYSKVIPEQAPHFIMGTIKRHPHIFTMIGVLRGGEAYTKAQIAPELSF